MCAAQQDTFSFALVLLCFATGDIDYLEHMRQFNYQCTRYYLGRRPPIPDQFIDNVNSEVLRGLINSMWQQDFRARPAMKAVKAVLGNLASNDGGDYRQASGASQHSGDVLLSDSDASEATRRHKGSPKSFALFLSHSADCAVEAGLVKISYETIVEVKCSLSKCVAHVLPPFARH